MVLCACPPPSGAPIAEGSGVRQKVVCDDGLSAPAGHDVRRLFSRKSTHCRRATGPNLSWKPAQAFPRPPLSSGSELSSADRGAPWALSPRGQVLFQAHAHFISLHLSNSLLRVPMLQTRKPRHGEAPSFARDHPACKGTRIQIQAWVLKPASHPHAPLVAWCHVVVK